MYEYSRVRRISRYIAGRDVWMSIAGRDVWMSIAGESGISRYKAGRDVWMSIKMKKSLMLINILYRMFNILQHKSSKGSLKLIL